MELIYAKVQAFALYSLDGVGYFIVAMTGALCKDVYRSINTKSPMEGYRVFAAAMLTTMIMYAIRDHINGELIPVVNFVLGVIGFELFVHISTIKGLIQTIIEFRALLFSLFKGASGGEDMSEKKKPSTRRSTKKANPPVQKAKELKKETEE